MKKFLAKVVLILAVSGIALVLGLFASSAFVQRNHFNNEETDSNLLVIKDNHHYDMVFLGISHARMFSRNGNHAKVERILDKTILNLGKGRASCGVNEQLFFLQYAYSRGATFDTLVYMVSPVLMYAGFLNQATNTFSNEPFRIDFLKQYLSFPTENKRSRILAYVRSKFTLDWFLMAPDARATDLGTLTELNMDAVEQGFKDSFKDGYNEQIFKRNCNEIKKTIALAKSHGTKVMFVFTPALFGHWPKHDETVAFFKGLEETEGTPFLDFSESINTPQLYYDNHHLTTEGVVLLTDSLLKPVLGSKRVN